MAVFSFRSTLEFKVACFRLFPMLLLNCLHSQANRDTYTRTPKQTVINGNLVWTLYTWQWHDKALIICLKMHSKLEMLHLRAWWCHFSLQGERSSSECRLKVNVETFSSLLSYSSTHCDGCVSFFLSFSSIIYVLLSFMSNSLMYASSLASVKGSCENWVVKR